MTVDTTRNRAELRHLTQSAHDRAEALWSADGSFTDQRAYAAWLAAMQHVHRQFGLPAAQLLGREHETAEQTRLAALSQDLDRDTPSGPVPHQQCQSRAWGILYALNGSALGASHLMKSGEMGRTWPNAYITCMRAYATSGRLKHFFDRLDTSRLDLTAASDGARQVFAAVAAPAQS